VKVKETEEGTGSEGKGHNWGIQRQKTLPQHMRKPKKKHYENKVGTYAWTTPYPTEDDQGYPAGCRTHSK
jgi:hypothetical protein